MIMACFAVLLIIIFIMWWSIMRMTFKISYYEAKLEHRAVDIEAVKFMPWYKVWIGYKED